MLVKTFQAVNMSEALKMVKAELGPDAMIISSKEERRKLFIDSVPERTTSIGRL